MAKAFRRPYLESEPLGCPLSFSDHGEVPLMPLQPPHPPSSPRVASRLGTAAAIAAANDTLRTLPSGRGGAPRQVRLEHLSTSVAEAFRNAAVGVGEALKSARLQCPCLAWLERDVGDSLTIGSRASGSQDRAPSP